MTADDDGGGLDGLAISQALARLDPGWQEPTGGARGLVYRRRDGAGTCVITTARDWIVVMVIASPRNVHTAAAMWHRAIWGDGIAYAVLPAGSDGSITLLGRADGQPTRIGPQEEAAQ